MSVETASKFISALNEQNFDSGLDCLGEASKMHTPMGIKEGKGDIKKMLEMGAKMSGGAPLTEPVEEDGEVYSVTQTPMGSMRMIFSFSGDGLIDEIKLAK